MEKEFYFDQVRNSVKKYNQIVILGYGEEDYIRDEKIYAEYNSRECKVSLRKTRVPFSKKGRKMEGKAIRMYSFIVDLPEGRIYSNDLLEICKKSSSGNSETIYYIEGKKIIRARKELKSTVNIVTANNSKMFVKGWAGYCRKPEVKVYDNKTKKPVPYKINWYERADVDMMFPEADEGKCLGFVIELDNSCKKYRITMQSKTATAVFKVKSVSGRGGLFCNIHNIKYLIEKVVFNVQYCGVKGTWTKIMNHLFPGRSGRDYNKWLKKNLPAERTLERQKRTKFDYNPKFSILVPLYETEEKYLFELVDSVKNQTYSNWEICFSDGSPDTSRLKAIVGKLSSEDARIRYVADKKGPLGISDNTNQALGIATGDFIVLGDHDDLFTPDALFECVSAINADSDINVIYSDEDKVDSKGKNFSNPHFKPDFNIDYLRSCNYICHMFVASGEVVKAAGGFDNEYDGSQDYDFILRCVEKAKKVHHIPRILYHWRVHSGSTASMPEVKMYCYESGRKALEAHYKRLGIDAAVEISDNLGYYKTTYRVQGNPKVSVIIANMDHSRDLKKCIDSILTKTDYDNYEIIIVENNSVEAETFEYYELLKKNDRIKVVEWKKEFNYSAVNNFGVESATGEYILLLNNDVEVINGSWMRDMLSYCQREDVGAVGARLYFEDDSIQHAGIIVGLGGVAAHAFLGMDEEEEICQQRVKSSCDYSAVTAACLMVKLSDYRRVGGLDENYTVALNDVDFCLKLREQGLLVVYDANAKLYHYESKSRGKDDTAQKMERFNLESRRLKERWPDIYKNGDPYYNPNLTLYKHDFSIKK